MNETDVWEEQYLSLVPEHFTLLDGRALQGAILRQPEGVMKDLIEIDRQGRISSPRPFWLPAGCNVHQARVLRALITRDPDRFRGALGEFIRNSED